MTADAPEGQVIIDEELGEEPGRSAEDSVDSGDVPTGAKPTTEKPEPDLLSEDSEEDLDEELATAGKPPVKPAAPAAAAPETKAPAKPESFKYTGDKKEHVLEGAQYYAGDGLYIPDSLVPKVKQLLAAAAVHNGSWQARERQYQAALKEAREGRTEKDVAADALMDLVFKDLGSLKTREEVEDWALNFLEKLPEYRLNIKEKQLEHRTRQFEQRQQPDPAVVEEQYSSVASQELGRTLDEIFQMPEMKVLDAEDQKELRAKLSGSARRLLSVADRDDSQQDIKKGDMIFDGAYVLEQVRVAAGIKSRTVTAHTAAQRAAEANRRKVGVAPVGARVPGPARATATETDRVPRDTRTGRFKTREEYEEWSRTGAE